MNAILHLLRECNRLACVTIRPEFLGTSPTLDTAVPMPLLINAEMTASITSAHNSFQL